MRAPFVRTLLSAFVAFTLLTAAAPATAAAPTAQLSVTLKSSQKTVTSGDTVTYTGEVKNLGDAEANLKIELDAPTYVKLAETKGATVAKNQATWSTTVASGKIASFTIDATITQIPTTERRVTTLASVYTGEDPSPVVRTANASFIAGVKDIPGGQANTAASTKNQAASPVAWIIGGVVLLLLIAAAVVVRALLYSKRKRARRLSVPE